MHEYVYDEETVRLALILGVVVGTLVYERLQVTTGGAIVPGYLALFILAPLSIVVTLGSGYLTYRLVNGPIASRVILYGRRKFEVEVLVGLAIVAVLYGIAQLRFAPAPITTALYGIGFVLPGVIAHDMFRQGPKTTLTAIILSVCVVGLAVFILVTLHEIDPPSISAPDILTPVMRGYPEEFILPAVVISVLAGLAVFRFFGLRTGGFVSAAYLAIVAPDLREILFTAAVAVTTYVVVTKVLLARLLLFGRRKLAMTILVSTVLAWSAELAITSLTGGAYHPWRGFNAITMLVPALIANDAERQGLERTAWGVALATLTVLAATNLLIAGLDVIRPFVTALRLG
ncbi:MAG: poly-gamma-glutamate biosynthesis protein PgsC/CapC [Candidatus Limnocylindrales bacterium]